jgi:capsid protein
VGETDDKAEDSDLAAKVSYLPGATVISGQPGDEFNSIKTEVPGLAFTENVLLYLRLIGIPLGLPIEIVLNDWSKTNYTSGRGALMQAFRKFLSLQETHESSFLRPWYKWKIQLAIEDGILPDRPDIYAHSWNWPTFPWIDELKEAEAWQKKITGGLATHSEALGSLGLDRSEYLVKADKEVREAIKIAQSIEKDTKEKVDWRMFAGREPLGKTAQAVNAGKDAAQSDPNADANKDTNSQGGDK